MRIIELPSSDGLLIAIHVEAIDSIRADGGDNRTRISLRGGSELRITESYDTVMEKVKSALSKD